MAETIGQRELRNDNAEIMRRVERGESFVVTRNGRPIADLVPHQAGTERRRLTTHELMETLARFPVDAEAWKRDIAEADEFFGPDDIGEGAG